MLLLNLGLDNRLLPSVLPSFQHGSPVVILLFIRMFNASSKPKIFDGFSKLSTVVNNFVYNLFPCFLKETNDLA